MFEEYLQDAYEFYQLGINFVNEKNDREARRYFRASVFYAAGAIEGYVDYIADAFAKGESLDPTEIAYLNDRCRNIEANKGTIIEKPEYHRLEDKVRFLLIRFGTGFDFHSNPSWSKLMEFKRLRDSLVHPHQHDDETPIHEYQKKIREGLFGVINVSNALATGLFKQPLRQQILDLIPD